MAIGHPKHTKLLSNIFDCACYFLCSQYPLVCKGKEEEKQGADKENKTYIYIHTKFVYLISIYPDFPKH